MRIVCFDLEMNQPSGKIIEIGYIVADPLTGKIYRAESSIIDAGEEIHPSIIELTGIDHQQGCSLAEAYVNMVKHAKDVHPMIFQWGRGDLKALKTQLDVAELKFTGSYDIKSLFQLHSMTKPNTKIKTNLFKATDQVCGGWDYSFGPPHRALADAYNTFRVYRSLTCPLRK